MCSYDSDFVSALEDVKRRISFWHEYLRYAKNDMLDFDERVESYIISIADRIAHIESLKERTPAVAEGISDDDVKERTPAVAEGISDDDETDEESPCRGRPGKVSYCGYSMRRYKPY